ncbi:MAG: hypothetical protein R3B91_08900 [Planctomycetaceae bacterium]
MPLRRFQASKVPVLRESARDLQCCCIPIETADRTERLRREETGEQRGQSSHVRSQVTSTTGDDGPPSLSNSEDEAAMVRRQHIVVNIEMQLTRHVRWIPA